MPEGVGKLQRCHVERDYKNPDLQFSALNFNLPTKFKITNTRR